MTLAVKWSGGNGNKKASMEMTCVFKEGFQSGSREALDRFIHGEQSFFKAQLNVELCGEDSPSIFNQPGDNSTRTSTSFTPSPPSPSTVPPHIWKLEAFRRESDRLGRKSEKSQRDFAEKHTEECFSGVHPTFQPPPQGRWERRYPKSNQN
ncbi:hypothetical protein CEXT_159961 [Caerostris extrusa]|uniref:Uncharacterized protein n=1 Tax=Caerostris extrusa TaxID=172846 RepID=A0AAV4TSK3_CAEEX|nr:hypothetical protein CEXT_159961 [Caerostris extrusa]